MSYSSEVVNTIKDISPEEWNEVIAAASTIRHEVLELEESDTTIENRARYFLLRDERKCLQAVAIAISVDKSSEYGAEGLVLGRFAQRLRVFKNCLRPALICGLLGHGSPVYVRQGENQKLWIKRILTAMETYVEKHKYSIGFSSVLSEQTGLMEELNTRGYCGAYSLPEAKIIITWEDEVSYLEKLRLANKKHYKTAKSEINRFRKAGISIAEWDGQDIQAIHQLLKKHHDERNKLKFRILPEYLIKLKDKLGDDCKIYTAKKGAELVGAIILLKKDGDAWAWRVGIDHVADKNSFTYFNIAYYYLLSNAKEINLNTIWYGNAALYAKIRRGCKVNFTYFYYKPRILHWKLILSVLFVLQRFWYQKKFTSYIDASD